MIERILTYLPNIDDSSLIELLNVIKQGNNFVNHFNTEIPDNEFELRYAQYLGNNNPEFIDYYKSIVEEACYCEFLEWYEYLVKNILRNDVQDVLGIRFTADNLNWEDEFKKSEIIGWAYKIKDYQLYIKNIDKVSRLGNIMKDFFNERTRPLSTVDEDYFQADHAQLVLDSIDNVIINDNREELIQQLASDKVICMAEVYGWNNRFNYILLNWLYQNKNKVQLWNKEV